MPEDISNKLVVAISSRALFDMSESHAVYENEGVDAYQKYQIENEDNILNPGTAFPLVQKFNSLTHPETNEPLAEVILLSRNSADTGLRVFNSIEHHGINIRRAAFTKGKSPYQYIAAFNSHLFLSANTEDVQQALLAGCAAATILPSTTFKNHASELRIAFDGDSVLFSDEAERIYQSRGLEEFAKNEKAAAKKPLPGGPFKGFLTALHDLQALFPADSSPIRTALVTARSAPAHERVIRTLRAWNIRIDEALFLGGLNKGEFLKAFQADFFFDDQIGHCESASDHVATAHVPHGIINEK